MANLLIVDDEREVGNFLAHLLGDKGHDISVVYDGKQFFEQLQKKQYQLAMIDVKLPDTNGLEILKRLKKEQPACKAIIMTGFSMVQTAVEAIKLGANDYIEKPFDDIDQLEASIDDLLKNDVTVVQNEMNEIASKLGFVIGESEAMKHLATMAFKIAKKNINVLLEGETGTGKEVLARFIHQASPRHDQTFIGVNCGALSEALLESELFGHEKGAFTGAIQQRKGLFEIASKGTLFLDEIAEASQQIQVKLLRILETREFMRVGSETTLRTNARIVAATHANLEQAVKAKEFREDLLYRLNVVKLHIPPLRQRKEDIPLLIDFLLAKHVERQVKFSSEAVSLLMNYEWPGNIRELANIVMRAITLSEGETDIITPQYLPHHLQGLREAHGSREMHKLHEAQESDESHQLHQSQVGKNRTSDGGFDHFSNAVKDHNNACAQSRELRTAEKAEMFEQRDDENKVAHEGNETSMGDDFEQYVHYWMSELLKQWEAKNSDFPLVLEQMKQLEAKVGQAFMKKALRNTLGNRKEAAASLKISERKLRYLLNEKRGG